MDVRSDRSTALTDSLVPSSAVGAGSPNFRCMDVVEFERDSFRVRLDQRSHNVAHSSFESDTKRLRTVDPPNASPQSTQFESGTRKSKLPPAAYPGNDLNLGSQLETQLSCERCSDASTLRRRKGRGRIGTDSDIHRRRRRTIASTRIVRSDTVSKLRIKLDEANAKRFSGGDSGQLTMVGQYRCRCLDLSKCHVTNTAKHSERFVMLDGKTGDQNRLPKPLRYA